MLVKPGGQGGRVAEALESGGRLAELLPYQDGRDAGGAELLHHLLVLGERFGAELAHIAQQGKFGRCLKCGKVLQSGTHRRRIGIVCIHNERIALRPHHLRTLVGRDERLYCGYGVGTRYAEVLAHGKCSQHVGGIVGTDQLCMHLAIFQTQVQEGLVGSGGQELRPLILHAIAEEMARQAGCHRAEVIVIFVYENEAART